MSKDAKKSDLLSESYKTVQHDQEMYSSYFSDRLFGSFEIDKSRNYQEYRDSSPVETNLPIDPPTATPINSSQDSYFINVSDSSDVNEDLGNIDELFSQVSGIPLMDERMSMSDYMYADNAQYPKLEIQASMQNPYLILEIFACLCLNIILCSNIFMFAIITTKFEASSDIIIRYVISKALNLSGVGLVTYIFTSPDTFKSISITLEYLSINSVIYEYKFMDVLRYLFIHFIVAIGSALLCIGMYYELIESISTQLLLSFVFSSKRNYSFSYSYIIVSILMHTFLSIGLTILTNMTNSMNSRQRAIHKALLTFFISLSYGAIIGPIGYVWPNLALYIIIIIIRNEYDLFNNSLFITYVVSLLATLIFYPVIAVQIKYFWRNKYRRYIEYGL